MNRQSLVRLTVMVVVFGYLTMFAGGIVYSQPEHVYFTYGKIETTAVFIKLPIGVEPPEFLEDPIKSMRQKGVAVPQSAEAPWREFADALQRLTDPQTGQSNSGRRRSTGVEYITFTIVIHGFTRPFSVAVADINNVTLPKIVSDSIGLDRFLNDPVRTLRAQRVPIPAADERAWKQLANALKALQLTYAKPSATLNRQQSNRSEQASAPTQSAQGRPAVSEGNSTDHRERGLSGVDFRPDTAQFDAGKGIESRQVVGSCNTTRGCVALKKVCETLPKHTFATDENGSIGVCADRTRRSNTWSWFLRNSNSAGDTSNEGGNNDVIGTRPGDSQAQGRRQYAPIVILKRVDLSTPSLDCEGAAICRKVQNTCETLGGTYKRITDVSGSCRH